MSVQEARGIVFARDGIGGFLSYVQNLANKVRTVSVGDIIASSDFNAKKQLLFELVKMALKAFLSCSVLVTPWDIRMVSYPTPGADYEYLIADMWCWKFMNIKDESNTLIYPFLMECRVGNQWQLNEDHTFSIKFEDMPYGTSRIMEKVLSFAPITGDWNDLIVTLVDYWADIFLYKQDSAWHVNVIYYEKYSCYSEAGFHNIGYRLLNEEERKAMGLSEFCADPYSGIGSNLACLDGRYAIMLCDNQKGIMGATLRFEFKDPDFAKPYLDVLNRIEALPTVGAGEPVNSNDWNALDNVIESAIPLVQQAILCLLGLKLKDWFPAIGGGSARADAFSRSRSYPNALLADKFFESIPKPKLQIITSEAVKCQY